MLLLLLLLLLCIVLKHADVLWILALLQSASADQNLQYVV